MSGSYVLRVRAQKIRASAVDLLPDRGLSWR